MDSYQRMLASLRDTFNKRIPGGLSNTADKRLQRALEHFTGEVKRVHGSIDEQTVLRETYDSMTKWYRHHTTELVPSRTMPAQFDPLKKFQDITGATPTSVFAPAEMDDTLTMDIGRVLDTIESSKMRATENPMDMFERMKASRETVTTAVVTEMPIPPELQSVETRPRTQKGPVEQKDVLQRQEDVIKYRETEYNLVLNSKDRNWLLNTKENRYNFSIQLESGRWPQGEGPQATIATRFRNIVRVEFVKALIPVEGLDVVMMKNCESGSNDPTAAFYSAMALPFINVILDEVDGNTVGTSDLVDRSLAICQYDATWRTDQLNTGKTTNRGYTLFFPKFMKAQRVYAPAPLANFHKLSFQILGPEGLQLSKTPDAHQVATVSFGMDISGSCYSDTSGSYLFIRTKEWFPVWAYSQLDKVEFRGLKYTLDTPEKQAAADALIEWLQRDSGHIVVGIANLVEALPYYDILADGPNSSGYANYIVIRNRFTNPAASGVETVDYFSGSFDGDKDISLPLQHYPPVDQQGGVLNLSRQVQIVLRVITRDMDNATNTRPDNV